MSVLRSSEERRLSAALVLALGLSGAAMATEGYFTHAWGTRAKGMGGAALAYPLDSMSGAMNPSLITHFGRRFDGSLAVFMPSRWFDATVPGGGMFPLAPGRFDSDSGAFLVPSFSFNWDLKDKKSSFALLVYGNGGMNTDYSEQIFGAGETGVNLEQMFISPTIATHVGPQTSVGLGIVYCIQKFEAKGLGNFAGMSSDPANLTNKGNDTSTGLGFKLGAHHHFNEKFSMGLNYAPKINMSKFDKYAGLFAGQGDFDIPESFAIGFAFTPTDKEAFAVDVRQVRYSGVKAVANKFASGGPLGADNGPGFGWRDMTVVKFGYENKMDPLWTWRLGASYGRQPIAGSEVLFNILAPGVQEWEFTGGFSRKLGKGELNFAAMYSPPKKVSGVNPMAPGQMIDLNMRQWEFEVGYSIKF